MARPAAITLDGMSREITPAAIVARLGALAASADETAPIGVAEAIEDASVAIAQALSQVRMLEADLSEATENEAEWRERASDAAARAASRRQERCHAVGRTPRWRGA